MSVGLFDMLGVQPRLGRGFSSGDGRPGSARVAIISEGLWRRRYAASADALGQEVRLNDEPYTIVGVMPPFRLISVNEAVWIPIDVEAAGSDPAGGSFYGLGRLAPGVSLDTARRLAAPIAAGMQTTTPLPRGWHLHLREKTVASVNAAARTIMFVLLGAVVFVLLVACANVANLFLSQASMRQREMAIRSALGASRRRLMVEVLVESLLLATTGGVLGVVLATWGVRAIAAAVPPNLVSRNTVDISVDGRVLAVAAIATFLSGLLFGLLPALRGSRPNLETTLRGAGDARTGHAAFGRTPAMLVIAEVAFSLILLVGAALMMRTMARLEAIEPGFEPHNLLAFHLDLPSDRYPNQAARSRFFDELRQRVEALPGVSDMTVTYGVPPSMGGFTGGKGEAEGRPSPDDQSRIIPINTISPNFFATLRIPLVSGRTFDDRAGDDEIIVSQGLANRYWPGESAVGRRFRIGRDGKWRTVIGVAGTVEARAAGETRTDLQIYQPWIQTPPSATAATPAPAAARRTYAFRLVVVRAENPLAMLPEIKAHVWAIDRHQPIDRIALVEDLYAEAFARQRFVLMLMGVFATIALALAAAGIFAVLSQLVVQRTREIGIRVALGARPAERLWLVVARGMGLAAVGALIGVAGAVALSRVLSTLLFEISPHDPVSFAGVVLALEAVAFVACWLPTRRAMRIDPAVSLRAN